MQGSKLTCLYTSSDPHRGNLLTIPIFGHPSGSICGVYFLTFYFRILPDILFWYSIYRIYPDILYIWHPVWHLFWHSTWHLYWHSILLFYLAFVLAFFLASILAFILSSILAFILAIFLVMMLRCCYFYSFYKYLFFGKIRKIGFRNRKQIGFQNSNKKKGLPNQDEPQLHIWEQHQHKTQAEPSTFYEECHCGYMSTANLRMVLHLYM